MWGPKRIVPVVTAQMEHLGPNLVTLGHLITFFQGPKGQICDYLGSQNGLIRWLMDLIESPGGPKSLQMGH